MTQSSWFKGLKGKLTMVAFMPVVGFTLVYFFALNGVNQINAMVESAHRDLIPNASYLGEMRTSRIQFNYYAWAILANPESTEKNKNRLQECRDGIQEFKDAYDHYTKATFQPGEEAIHEKVKSAVPQFLQAMTEIADALEQNDFAKARLLIDGESYTVAAKKVRTFNLDVNDLYQKVSKEEEETSKQTAASVAKWLLIFSLSSAVLVFGILTWIGLGISKKVEGLTNELSGAGEKVSSSVEQLNSAGQSLASASSQAASSLEETVAALEEMTSIVQKNSDHAKEAANLSLLSKTSAEKGEQEIHTLIQSMQQISKSSKQIEEIINVIDDIAFQTNLLALNAAVESARAGEQGKGFAVVAEAVRGLAQRSASAAKDIANLIQTSVSQIEQGSEIADRSGLALNQIVQSVKKVSDLNAEIATASSEQASGIQQINKAMNQLDQAVQSNAASAEEIAATGEEINHLAKTSKELTVNLESVILGSVEDIKKAA